MQTTILQRPTLENFDLESVKDHLNIEHTKDDATLLSLLYAAYEIVQGYLGTRAIYPTKFRDLFTKDDVTNGVFLQAIPILIGDDYPIEVRVSSETAVQTVLADTNYMLIGLDQKQLIPSGDGFGDMPISDQALVIEYFAGYETVPAIIKSAIRQMVGILYENENAEMPKPMQIGLSPFRFNVL